MDSPHTPLQQEQQEQQQQKEYPGVRPQPSNLSTSSIGSAATFVTSPLSPFFHRGGASAYEPITGISEDYMTSCKGAGAERQQQSPSPSLRQQQQEFSPVSPLFMGSGAFAGHRPQGLGVRYNNSGAAKMFRQGPPPPVSRGNVTSGSPDEGGEAAGSFRGLESHLEEEEEGKEGDDNSIGHMRATSFGTLDYGRAPPSPQPPSLLFFFFFGFDTFC